MRTLRTIKIFIASIIISLSLGGGLAFADPPEQAPTHGYYKNKGQDYDDDDDHDKRYKKSKRYDDDDDHDDRYKKSKRYDNDDHGDRYKKSKRYDDDDHDDRYKKPRRYNNNVHGDDYNRGRQVNYETLSCDQSSFSRSNVGSVIGGILGGILGSNIGKGNGKTLATIAGVIVGASIGNNIGSSMDEADRYCAGQALGNAQDNQTVAWKNPDTHREYTVTPERSYTQDNGRQCRNYTSTVIIDGRQEQATGKACKDYSGNWQIIN